jgi:hypothetical protein
VLRETFREGKKKYSDSFQIKIREDHYNPKDKDSFQGYGIELRCEKDFYENYLKKVNRILQKHIKKKGGVNSYVGLRLDINFLDLFTPRSIKRVLTNLKSKIGKMFWIMKV